MELKNAGFWYRRAFRHEQDRVAGATRPGVDGAGLVVSLIKHSHKAIEIDCPGKDSFRLREAGCKEVLLLGNERWALMHELRGADEPPLDYLLERLQHCDLVLIEGFKHGDFPKLEVWRQGVGATPLWPEWPGIVAIAGDALTTAAELPVFSLAAIDKIADFAISRAATR